MVIWAFFFFFIKCLIEQIPQGTGAVEMWAHVRVMWKSLPQPPFQVPTAQTLLGTECLLGGQNMVILFIALALLGGQPSGKRAAASSYCAPGCSWTAWSVSAQGYNLIPWHPPFSLADSNTQTLQGAFPELEWHPTHLCPQGKMSQPAMHEPLKRLLCHCKRLLSIILKFDLPVFTPSSLKIPREFYQLSPQKTREPIPIKQFGLYDVNNQR